MAINKEQLEINVNLHALEPNFFNSELYYVIASDEKTFRFVNWDEKPQDGEQRFYCFLTEEELYIPAGDIKLEESYVLREESIYPEISGVDDMVKLIEQVRRDSVAKGIRCFTNDSIESLYNQLKEKYSSLEKHMVTSDQGQHLLLLLDDIEISVSANMVYFRNKTAVNESHYKNVKEEQQEQSA